MINRVVLIGRLTKDPELRYTPTGVAVARFILAVNRIYTNQQGERAADFINCVVWRKQAENTANFLCKGSLAGVEGRIQTGSYEGQDGQRIYTTEVIADSIQFLDSRQEQRNENNSNQFPNQQHTEPLEQTYKGPTSVTKQYNDPYVPNKSTDDDFPF